MILTNIEKQSALWSRIRDELHAKLSLLRSRNDGDLDQFETARLRGKIAAIKELLAWEEPNPAPMADEQ